MGTPAPSVHKPAAPSAPAPLANNPPAASPVPRAPAAVSRLVPNWAVRATRTLRGQFLLLGILILGLCLVQAYLTARTFAQTQAALVTITRSSVPSIEAARAMAQTLEELDAQAAIYLTSGGLTEPVPCALIGDSATEETLPPQACAALNLDAGILLFNRHLYAAAHNVTYSGERTAIERITAAFQEYVAHLTVMQAEYEAATVAGDATDPAMQRALAAYEAARLVLHENPSRQPDVGNVALLAAAESDVPPCFSADTGQDFDGHVWPKGSLHLNLTCLGWINQAQMGAAFGDARSSLDTGWYVLLGLEVPLALFLLLATFRMIFISRRVFNPGLTLALVGGLALGFVTLTTLASLSSSVWNLVREEYEALYQVADLKQRAMAAHASHARWLLAQQANQPEAAEAALADWQQQRVSLSLSLADVSLIAAPYGFGKPESPLPTVWQSYADVQQAHLDELGARADRAQVQAAMGPALEVSNRTFRAFLAEVDTLNNDTQMRYRMQHQGIEATLTQYRLYSMLLFPLVGLLALWGIALRLRDF